MFIKKYKIAPILQLHTQMRVAWRLWKAASRAAWTLLKASMLSQDVNGRLGTA
eukprot:CAMPEP_0114270298 /NCGR_PEP_ID=MMETSP0058-20121206/27157_1 /TAXON_ID=36894 /ORGANISM="Pyramimonas parkeae, CCMP726" /LENGTH=52 /DNA_ID=CAMNT_0001389013 /DNA_START=21 /DNA_END=179 /DNA_ORIENTATION=+